ncbi:MAG: hypothetical protein JXR12_05960 [Neptunomonas phycophila]|uniref:hypothetical protein n=1 Tax=Neptunomonas phycophila TaxID=1572645 RepID=UPI003B8E3E36
MFWKSGGSSVASIGQTYNGTRWMAPANWTTSEDNVFTAQNLTDDEIKGIEKIILITT